jgi:hypothetical protein
VDDAKNAIMVNKVGSLVERTMAEEFKKVNADMKGISESTARMEEIAQRLLKARWTDERKMSRDLGGT